MKCLVSQYSLVMLRALLTVIHSNIVVLFKIKFSTKYYILILYLFLLQLIGLINHSFNVLGAKAIF